MNLNELIDGCIKQQRIAQKKLYEMYYGKMMSICLRYTSDSDQAKDILNRGFFKAFKSMEQFNRVDGNFDGWLYRIMVHTAIDIFRKEFKHRSTDELPVNLHDTGNDIHSILSAEDILKLVQELPNAYRTVFNLFVVDGFSHQEIADKLGITVGSSKSNLAKARAKLQDLLIKRYNYKM